MRSLTRFLLFVVFAINAGDCIAAARTPESTADTATILDHSEMIFRKGTRSEGRSGFLTYKGSIVPDCFQAISDGKVMYRFYERTALWGREGYYPDSKTLMRTTDFSAAVDQRVIDRGWFEGVARPTNIPKNWFYVAYQNGSAWIDPAMLGRFCDEKSLKPFKRREPMFRKTK